MLSESSVASHDYWKSSDRVEFVRRAMWMQCDCVIVGFSFGKFFTARLCLALEPCFCLPMYLTIMTIYLSENVMLWSYGSGIVLVSACTSLIMWISVALDWWMAWLISLLFEFALSGLLEACLGKWLRCEVCDRLITRVSKNLNCSPTLCLSACYFVAIRMWSVIVWSRLRNCGKL